VRPRGQGRLHFRQCRPGCPCLLVPCRGPTGTISQERMKGRGAWAGRLCGVTVCCGCEHSGACVTAVCVCVPQEGSRCSLIVSPRGRVIPGHGPVLPAGAPHSERCVCPATRQQVLPQVLGCDSDHSRGTPAELSTPAAVPLRVGSRGVPAGAGGGGRGRVTDCVRAGRRGSRCCPPRRRPA
jgi:hypothetical protein